MKRPILYALWFCIVFVVVFTLLSCKTGGGFQLPFVGGGHPTPKVPQDKTLSQMAWWAFIPGILMLAASYWIPPLRSWGGTFLGVGIGTAIVSALVHDYSHWITLAAFGAVAIWAVAWHGPEVIRRWKEGRESKWSLSSGESPLPLSQSTSSPTSLNHGKNEGQ